MRFKKYLSAIFLVLVVSLLCNVAKASGFPIAKEKWVARYNGASNDYDGAWAVAIDTSGNVYVTGTCDGYGFPGTADYATIKYDSNGNQLWLAKYNGTGNGADMAWDIATDISDNIYVTGTSTASDGDRDFVTIKYDTEGNELWVARWNSPSFEGSSARNLAVDNLGNVYVLGHSRVADTVEDYVTLKYDPNGNKLWEARYDGPANSSDHARAITVDSSGNVYVTGRSKSGTFYDYATIKYAPDSNEPVWVARYNGPGNDSEEVTGIAIDSSGNVYVTGESENLSGDGDYATVKYDPNGNELWVARYDGGRYDTPHSVAIDSSDNVYVTGVKRAITTETTSSDFCTIKYDLNGNQLWLVTYNGPDNKWDSADAMAIDNSDNIYVSGRSESVSGDDDYLTIKYDPNGNELWTMRYNGPGNYKDNITSIVLDDFNNVYITGESWGDGTNSDYATIKYSQIFCTSKPAMDFNKDCKVDFEDFALFTQSWLDCNLDPPETCWE